ncbi:spore coat associated protein CotJA [Clostridium sp. AF18-27]|jgi:hypothetical protein|nr:hypothetical protein CLOSTASPAR_00327 [[Clostridium] asparagiforme DSM 15981]MBS5604234.1 spore coat associated protein CotJA [Enterocloster asparagiformis]PST30751.1 spore coat associated protein CotJA [Enterocloster lavalensis]RGX23696.1 spore coat associated protein CotJA [Enterocloster asparagiformis]RHR55942.1 spore coat associated protein CotJA [Clostridium sp. AF18-27]
MMKGVLKMDFCKNLEMAQDILPLAIATVPMQPWETPYDAATALKQGTIFPCLDKPFYVTGGEKHA